MAICEVCGNDYYTHCLCGMSLVNALSCCPLCCPLGAAWSDISRRLTSAGGGAV
jgi:hypothetical protein